jgi:putative colanic acid biosynthesis UDP-glucose lipid carrier transferase
VVREAIAVSDADKVTTLRVPQDSALDSSAARASKFLQDQVGGVLLLLLAAPLLVALALAIKLTSRGPVFFTQARHGWHGREFTIYKFRTMFVHAEAQGKVTQARRRDPRITRVGAFLRRTSLDELPQLLNVVKGDMSLIGPRPHAVEHNFEFRERVMGYMARHRVKPGITGWAQVNGHRGAINSDEELRARFEHDMWYVRNWSTWLDFKILLLTIYRGFVHPNAF